MHRVIAFTAAALVALALAVGAVADSVYHTTRIPLKPVGSAPGGGTVVNIHANGPKVFANELYLLKHATPGTYQVAIHIFSTSQNCSGSVLDLSTATLKTNGVGNGKAQHKFTPSDAAGLRGRTLSAFWTVDGPAHYATQCSVITLD
jgi:hypothetical protein